MSAPSKPRGWVVRTPEGYVGPRGGRVSAQAKAKRHRTEDAARAVADTLPGAEVVPMRSTPRRDGAVPKLVTMPAELWARIDAAAGGNRSAWLARKAREALERDAKAGQQAASEMLDRLEAHADFVPDGSEPDEGRICPGLVRFGRPCGVKHFGQDELCFNCATEDAFMLRCTPSTVTG